MHSKVKVVLVDDHALLRTGLASLTEALGHAVIYECNNGKELTEKIYKNDLPEIILIDINMPVMDGFETASWLKKNFPLIPVIALSMYDDEISIIRMIKNGVRGYILKDADPAELKEAIEAVMLKGFYYSDLVSGKLIRKIQQEDDSNNNDHKSVMGLNERQIELLKLCASEMTYKEIADKMHVSPRTVDGYRDDLFQKLNIKNRVGLVLFAIKNRLVHFN